MKRLVFTYFMLLLLASCASSDEAFKQVQSLQKTNERLAEYQSPRTILMHCPGNEVAGSNGRNKRFDKEAMKTEHKAYASLLMSKGIEVIEVTDVLRKAPIERLRAIATELSANDVSSLSADQLIEHILCIPPMKGFYYTRDQSITTPRGHIVGKMKLSHRRFEPELIELCYATMNRHVAHRITGSDAVLEGGDYLPFRTISLIGLGLRTNQKAIDELLQADAFGHDTVVVVKDHLFNTLQMHLDTYFNIIDSNLVTMAQQRIDAQPGEDHYLAADIYTRAKGETAYTKTSTDIPFVGFLRNRGIEIIGLSADDEENFGNNYLCIGPRRIIAPNSVSAAYRERMAQAGVVADYVEMSELTEGNGAAHCMTQVVDR